MYQVIANESELEQWLRVSDQVGVIDKHMGIKKKLQQVVASIDREYSPDRDLQRDLGGYVVILYGDTEEVRKHYKKILNYHHLKEEEYEYEEAGRKSERQEALTFRLYLCSSDYAVGILMIENEKER